MSVYQSAFIIVGYVFTELLTRERKKNDKKSLGAVEGLTHALRYVIELDADGSCV